MELPASLARVLSHHKPDPVVVMGFIFPNAALILVLCSAQPSCPWFGELQRSWGSFPRLQEFQWFLPKISYSLWIFTLSQARIICLSAQPQGADLQRLLPTPAMLGFCVGWVKLGIHPPLSLHFATKFTPQHHMVLVVLERGRKKERWLRSGFFLLRKIEIGGQSTSNTAKYWPRNESHSPTFLWCWNSSSGAAQTPQILINHPNPTETL